MTRFIGDALGARKPKASNKAKERKKDLETFLETGIHPELRRQGVTTAAQPLPEPSSSRPYVFFEISIGRNSLGKIVVECFEDVAPLAVGHFRNRCSDGTLKNTSFHKILRGNAAFFGKTSSIETLNVKRYFDLRHVDPGVVSVSLDGSEICITFAPGLHLDPNYQVVGRVSLGQELLDKLSSVPVDTDEVPIQRVSITNCGFANVKGEPVDGGEKPKDFDEVAAETREQTKQALETGLGQKRKAEQSNKPVKKVMGMLDDLSDVSSDEEEDE